MAQKKKEFTEALEQELKLVQNELSMRRKKAQDVKIAEILHFKIKAKIQMADFSETKKDIDIACRAIEAVWAELGMEKKIAIDAPQPAVSVPVSMPALAPIDALVAGLRQAFAAGNMEEGAKIYNQIKQIYPALSPEKKKEVAAAITAAMK